MRASQSVDGPMSASAEPKPVRLRVSTSPVACERVVRAEHRPVEVVVLEHDVVDRARAEELDQVVAGLIVGANVRRDAAVAQIDRTVELGEVAGGRAVVVELETGDAPAIRAVDEEAARVVHLVAAESRGPRRR